MTVGPVADRLRNLNERAEQLRVAINATQGPVPRSNIEGVIPQAELNIPGVIRREPVTRISPSTQNVLGPGRGETLSVQEQERLATLGQIIPSIRPGTAEVAGRELPLRSAFPRARGEVISSRPGVQRIAVERD